MSRRSGDRTVTGVRIVLAQSFLQSYFSDCNVPAALMELEPGDTIQVGPVTFVLQVNGVPADDQLKPHGKERAAAATDEDDLETLEDEEGGNHDLETLGEDEGELETLDEDKTHRGGGAGG